VRTQVRTRIVPSTDSRVCPVATRIARRNTGGVEHSIRFGDGPEDALIATSGLATMGGLDSVVTDLLSDDRYMPAMDLLFDHTQLDWDGLRAEDILRRLHMPLKAADMIGPRRIAVVASDLRFAEARALRRDEPTWKAFTSLEDGRAWLVTA
jgi:hypothetical protein